MKQLKSVIFNVSRATLLSILGLAIAAGLMLFQLASLTPGLSHTEMATAQSASSFSAIADNMVNAPYKTAVLISTKLFDSAFGLRLVGAVVGAASIVAFYLLVRQLFGKYISIIVTIMFGSSSLLLHNSRLATPNVMLLVLLALIAAGFYLRFGKRKDLGWMLIAATVGISLYTPGMIIFILGAALWQFRHVRKSFEQLSPVAIVITSVIFGILCVPLVVSLIRDIDLWRGYLGLPMVFEPFMTMVKYAGTAVASLFAISPHDPVYWLGRQPVLDVFATAMFVYGAYNLIRQYRLDRLWTILGIFLIAILWIGASTNRQGIIILLPFVYIVIGIGIQNFLNIWLKVFPRNPIARTTGSLLLLAAICLSVNFQAYRYFIAWPNSNQTKAVFQQEFRK